MAEKEEYEAKQKELEAVVSPILQNLSGGAGGMPGGMPGGKLFVLPILVYDHLSSPIRTYFHLFASYFRYAWRHAWWNARHGRHGRWRATSC